MTNPKPKLPAGADMEWWHNAVFGPNPSRNAIPFRVLRAYLDELATAKRLANGLYNMTITVTKKPMTGVLNWDLMLEKGIDIKAEGQKW